MTRLLAEDLVLLCWDDDKGRLHQRCSTTVGPGVGGALVVDAVLSGALALAADRVQVTGTDPGDPMLNEVVAAANRRRPPRVARLVQQVGTTRRYKAVRDRLVDQGVLAADRRRLLGGVPYTRFPPADPGAMEALRESVRALLTGRMDPSETDPRYVVLAGLAVPTGAVDVLVARGQRTTARRLAAAFGDPHATPAAAGQSVQEQHTAAIAAVTGAVAAGTASGVGSAPTPGTVPRRARAGGRAGGEGAAAVGEPAVAVADGPAAVEEPAVAVADRPVADGPAAVGAPDADVPVGPGPVEDALVEDVPPDPERPGRPPGDGDAGDARGLGVGLGVGAALLIGIGVVGRRLAARARKRSTDD